MAGAACRPACWLMGARVTRSGLDAEARDVSGSVGGGATGRETGPSQARHLGLRCGLRRDLKADTQRGAA